MKDDMKLLYPKILHLGQIAADRSVIRNELEEQNARLQAQLDREIKINRKMKRALEKYAESEPLEIKREYFNNEPTNINKTMADIGMLAREVLKEIENKE